MDIVLEKLIKEELPLTKRNYRLFAWWDADHEVVGAEWSLLPTEYEDWPEGDEVIN
jgi:hypothetical protein